MYRTVTSLVKFIPKHLTVFDAIVNEIVFSISLSYSLLLAYRNTTEFCMFVLNPKNLMNLFISSKSFLVEYLGFSINNIISSANKDNFTSSFLI